MVVVGTGDKNSKYLKTEWPVEEGNTLGTTKIDGKTANLVPQASIVREIDQVGL